MNKKILVLMPIDKLSDTEISIRLEEIVNKVYDYFDIFDMKTKIKIIDSFDDIYRYTAPMECLINDLTNMDNADIIVFGDEYSSDINCSIENMIAGYYGKKVLYESSIDVTLDIYRSNREISEMMKHNKPIEG